MATVVANHGSLQAPLFTKQVMVMPGQDLLKNEFTAARGDLFRIAFGVTATLTLLLFGASFVWVWWVCALILVLTLFVAAKTAVLAQTRIVFDDDGIEIWLAGPQDQRWAHRVLPWSALKTLTVRNYTSRGFFAPIWIALTLYGQDPETGRAILLRMDHRLMGFPRVVERAWLEVRNRRLPLDRTTVENLTALTVHGRINGPSPRRGPPPWMGDGP